MDLHKLFVEVTSRGGINKVCPLNDLVTYYVLLEFALIFFVLASFSFFELQILHERRWKEVTATFVFPPTATNASYVLRKYYFSLLSNYEQIYFFKSNGQIPPGLPTKLFYQNPILFS